MEKKSLVHTLIQQCLACAPVNDSTTTNNKYRTAFFHKNIGPSTQFVELTGIRFIGLGAMVDELSARERVYDTLEVFRNDPDRLLCVGYINVANGEQNDDPTNLVSSVPVNVWERECTDEASMSVAVQKTTALVRKREFKALVRELEKQLRHCRSHMAQGIHFYSAGIVAHNLGVAKLLTGEDGTSMFLEAISLKEAAFGGDHDEVALSWEQLGIQQFAGGDFDTARFSFQKAHRVRANGRMHHPILGMTLNNIACCDFQAGQHEKALESLEEAREIQHRAVGSSVQNDLDLIHVAIVYCNCGYLNLALKKYETADQILQEALLIQQSVLEDSHRSIRDTLSNLEFANAFHS